MLHFLRARFNDIEMVRSNRLIPKSTGRDRYVPRSALCKHFSPLFLFGIIPRGRWAVLFAKFHYRRASWSSNLSISRCLHRATSPKIHDSSAWPQGKQNKTKPRPCIVHRASPLTVSSPEAVYPVPVRATAQKAWRSRQCLFLLSTCSQELLDLVIIRSISRGDKTKNLWPSLSTALP